MPRCPKCNEEIDHLENFVPAIERYDFTVDEDGNTDYYSVGESLSTTGDEEYCCPKCGECLCTLESEAINILKGKEN